MIDISMQGATLTFSGGGLESNVVLEFSDEGTPLEFPDLEVCGYSMTMNGELVTWTKPTPVTFRISVIPGSVSDTALRNLLYAGHVGGKRGMAINQQSVYIATATLTVPVISTATTIIGNGSKKTFTFHNGRLTGGNPAIGSNAEGKMSVRTYNFVFESVS
ncbi:MAG: hypothetical protein J6V72_16865 [Kiritimatiellae bacterium]|nr:hypothetical protein [Kiritimatiellia bacterium]